MKTRTEPFIVHVTHCFSTKRAAEAKEGNFEGCFLSLIIVNYYYYYRYKNKQKKNK